MEAKEKNGEGAGHIDKSPTNAAVFHLQKQCLLNTIDDQGASMPNLCLESW